MTESKSKFLHGRLTLHIYEGKNLPNLDAMQLKNLLPGRAMDLSDPYVTVDTMLDGKKTCRLIKTRVIDDCLNPQWNEKKIAPLCHTVDSFRFVCKDKDPIVTDTIGSFTIPVEELKRSGKLEGWYKLHGKKAKRGQIRIKMEFQSIEIIAKTLTNEVPNTYFPAHPGNYVRFYQDAHTPDEPPVNTVPTRDGSPYVPPCNWVELVAAIESAEKFIYVGGLSFWPDCPLTRSHIAGHSQGETVGELLKRKAKEGVEVKIIVWDDIASVDLYPPGMAGYRDNETKMYFAGTGVAVALAYRKKAMGTMTDSLIGTTYTHHQKFVILDRKIEGGSNDGRRHIAAFAGGIDITDGRYDTQKHELFKTLVAEHADDCYNGVCPPVKATYGPREPWHDIHMYVEGPAALDIMRNFQERWRKQGRKGHGQMPITEENFDLGWTAPEDGDNAQPTFTVQLFRSINSDSAVFETDKLHILPSRKGRAFDDSIQRAYIHHIRRAERFIYVENQYFMGSSHDWRVRETAKCPNLVPIELCARIERAINEGKDFRVYILLPLHAEGVPNSATIQEMIRWQYRTLEMMYGRIADAIKAKGIDAHPMDYLTFFCLGKTEGSDDVPQALDAPPANSVAAKVREMRRFMIYVHSKIAIFDDEYILVGSANVNERSQNGNRDSEMCLGMWQPGYTKETAGADGKGIEGDIRTFRLALWAEHTGAHSPVHLDARSGKCMSSMRTLAESNLERFLRPDGVRNDSHLMLLPLEITAAGEVKAREDCPTFPDTGGSLLGKTSDFLPNSITT